MYSADQFEKPDAPHSVVKASDGSEWYQMASGANAGTFYSAPNFSGAPSEAEQVAATFPDAPEGTILRTADDGVIEASTPGEISMLYSSALYDEPSGPHSVVTDADGNEWYQVSGADIVDGTVEAPQFNGNAGPGIDVSGGTLETPQFDRGSNIELPQFEGMQDTPMNAIGAGVVAADTSDGEMFFYNSENYNAPEGTYSTLSDSNGNEWYQISAADIAEGNASVPEYSGDNNVTFSNMAEDTSLVSTGNGVIEASSEDGNSMLYSASSYAEPEGEHSVVTADDGSKWYQIPVGADGSFNAPQYTGAMSDSMPGGISDDMSNSNQGAVNFPGMAEGTSVTHAGDGVMQAEGTPGSNTLWYNSANFEEPDAPHTTMQAANGVEWYAMKPNAEAPEFEQGESALAYNQAQFQAFMPGYEQKVSSVDGSKCKDGQFEIRHADGNGTMFYDVNRYAAPRGDYQVYEDVNGSQWYAIKGEAAVDRKPVFKDGKAVYEDGKLQTTNVETVRYKNTPSRFSKPKRREKTEIKAPKRKK